MGAGAQAHTIAPACVLHVVVGDFSVSRVLSVDIQVESFEVRTCVTNLAATITEKSVFPVDAYISDLENDVRDKFELSRADFLHGNGELVNKSGRLRDYSQLVVKGTLKLTATIRNRVPQLEFDMESTARIRQVKEIVHREWVIPLLCQKIASGGAVLSDEAQLGHHADIGDSITLALVVDPPYRNDIQMAVQAGDRPAIRALIQFRDAGRHQGPPSALKAAVDNICICDALVGRGYSHEDIHMVWIALGRGFTFNGAVAWLEQHQLGSNEKYMQGAHLLQRRRLADA